MKPSTMLVTATLVFTLGSLTFAQQPSTGSSSSQSGSSVAAYVYVSSSPSTGNYEINGYSADSTGTLTPIAGSPFPGSVQYMAVNGAWLFGADNYTSIDSFSIGSNGALQQVSTINATQYNPYNSGGPGNIFLDHSGATLYAGDIYAYGTGSNAYESFAIDQSTGQLNFIALGPDGGTLEGPPMSFTGSNIYAYSSGCYEGSGAIYGYQRNSDGSLSLLNISPSLPAAPKGDNYCPYLAAADTTNHVAVSLTPLNFYTPVGQPQLAVYTQDNSGNLTTTSTSANMPKTTVSSINDIWMSPSGKLLAVAGSTGLEVFHFNGASPITPYTGSLTKNEIDQVFWDNANHLYAISNTAGKLYVLTVTPTSYRQAPGSPYTITSPQNLIVLPR
jgi:hypothetical protein